MSQREQQPPGPHPPEAAPFELIGGHPALDFTNTVSWDGAGDADEASERLRSFGDLVAWARQAGVVSDAEARALGEWGAHAPWKAAAALAQARTLRAILHALLSARTRGTAPSAAHVRAFNEALGDALAALDVAWEDGEFVWRQGDAESLDLVAWRVAWAAAQLMTSPAADRIRRCANDRCGWLFLDTTKNRSRRWCSMRDCGSREKARRYYRRRRGGQLGTAPRDAP